MKKTLIGTGIVVFAAFLVLYILTRVTSKRNPTEFYTEVEKGQFEIAVTSAGELLAEKSIEIKGPEIAMGRDIRFFNIKITDLIPEGTVVKEGDYVGTLDRTDLNNNLKDAQESLLTLQTNLNMKLLDTAVALTDLRDQIKNQRFAVEEAKMTLHNSKFEPPTTIREAEISLDKSQRVMEQLQRSYAQKLAQNKTDIFNQTYWVNKGSKKVKDLEEVLAEFTIKAPASGMVIYKRDWDGKKVTAGSTMSVWENIVATLRRHMSMR